MKTGEEMKLKTSKTQKVKDKKRQTEKNGYKKKKLHADTSILGYSRHSSVVSFVEGSLESASATVLNFSG